MAYNRIEELFKQAVQNNERKEDLFISPSNLTVDHNDGRIYMPGNIGGYELSDWAQGQFCRKIGVPEKYYKTLPNHLKSENANYWIEQLKKQDDRNLMFRVKHGEDFGLIRGVLSEKYSILDNHELLEMLTKMFDSTGKDYKIEYVYNNDDVSFHLRITLPEFTTSIGKTFRGEEDVHKVGIHISNSEVGRSAVRITPMVYRLVCKNGLMAWRSDETFTQRHIGLRHTEIYNRVAEAVVEAVQGGDAMLEQLVQAKETKIINPFETIDKIAKDKKYSKPLTDQIKNNFMEEPQNNVFSIVQAFTATARTMEGDSRIEMETDGHEVLTRLLQTA